MKPSNIRITEAPGQYESLALALQAVAAARDVQLEYDDLCAALGISFAAVSTRLEAAPGWWMTYGRDLLLEKTARLFGFWLRPLQPPDVGPEMRSADEYAQHWQFSHLPLVQRAIENDEPVLAWRGWPDSREPFWGVVTRSDDAGLWGTTVWSQGDVVKLVGPALQCYVVENFEQCFPAGEALLATALKHADAFMNGAPFAPPVGEVGPPPIVTGPAAFDAWELWLQSEGASQEGAAGEHRQHAEFLATSRQAAGRFLRRMREVAGGEYSAVVSDAIDYCDAVVQWLDESRDQDAVEALLPNPHGRERLLAAVNAAEAADRRLANCIEELAGRLAV